VNVSIGILDRVNYWHSMNHVSQSRQENDADVSRQIGRTLRDDGHQA
jgi:hypothetical protein